MRSVEKKLRRHADSVGGTPGVQGGDTLRHTKGSQDHSFPAPQARHLVRRSSQPVMGLLGISAAQDAAPTGLLAALGSDAAMPGCGAGMLLLGPPSRKRRRKMARAWRQAADGAKLYWLYMEDDATLAASLEVAASLPSGEEL